MADLKLSMTLKKKITISKRYPRYSLPTTFTSQPEGLNSGPESSKGKGSINSLGVQLPELLPKITQRKTSQEQG